MSDNPHNVTIVIDYFTRLNYPREPIREDAREYLNRFFREDGFIRLCDRMFGKYFWRSESERTGCWMDTANRYPNGAVAAELFKLISPGSHFFNALEAFSASDSSFASQLKYKWNFDDAEEVQSSKYTIDFPLGSLYQHYMRFLSESETDVYDLSRSSCPGFIFIPFWIPPLVTRREKSQGRILTSLRCKPLPYFFIRLIWYLFSRTDSLGQHMITDPLPSGNAIAAYFKQLFQLNTKCTSFSFYNSIATVYIQYYITPAFIRNVSSRNNLEDVTWSVRDVSAGMLLCYSLFLSSRCFPEIDYEYQRRRRSEPCSTANLFGFLPILTELYSTLYRECSTPMTITLDFSVDSVSRSCNDIFFVQRSTFRNCLIAIREAMFSLDNVSNCKLSCFLHLLKLWKILLNPLRPEHSRYFEEYVAAHLEAYVFVFCDILEGLLKNNFFQSVDLESALVLRKILEYYNMDAVNTLFQEFLKKSGDSSLAQYNFVLNWKLEDSISFLPSVFDKEALFLATCASGAMREKMLTKKCSASIKKEVEKCINLLEKIFPGSENSFSDASTEQSFRYFSEKAAAIYQQSERKPCTKKNSSDFFNKQLCTRSSLHSGACKDEVPFIAAISKHVDCVLVLFQEFFYRNSIPRCSLGHKLFLREKVSRKCVLHSSTNAIWCCGICDTDYCAGCRSLPIGLKGATVLEENIIPSSCCVCNKFVDQDCISFRDRDTAEVYCAICASRPFLPWSVRWIASFKTLTLGIILLVLCMFFSVLIWY